MCVFVITLITFCLCASPKLSDSIKLPVKIKNLQDYELLDFMYLCHKFLLLTMSNNTIYTTTHGDQLPILAYINGLYKGTAKFIDYQIPVDNKTLLDMYADGTIEQVLPELSLRTINVVESVGVFLISKMCVLARDIVIFSREPRELLGRFLPMLHKIKKKFYQLSIPRMPIDDLKKIIKYNINQNSNFYIIQFRKACTSIRHKYWFLNGFVDIGNVDQIGNTEESLRVVLEFIETNVDNYFQLIGPLDGQWSLIAASSENVL